MESKSLRLIHSGRLLTDGILLLGWLRSLEARVKRQAGGVGGDVESVLKDVGLAEEDEEESRSGSVPRGNGKRKDSAGERVWLHCVVGAKVEETPKEQEEEVSTWFNHEVVHGWADGLRVRYRDVEDLMFCSMRD